VYINFKASYYFDSAQAALRMAAELGYAAARTIIYHLFKPHVTFLLPKPHIKSHY
jgi:hypothetical protein